MRRLAIALGTVLLVSSSIVLGHDGATGLVKQRMDDMKAIGRSAKRIGDRLQSKRSFTEVATEAEAIGAAAARMPSLFPRGSRDDHTEATAAVWERWSEFTAASRTLVEASGKLASAARSGQEAEVVGQFRAVTRACGDCHRTFRARN